MFNWKIYKELNPDLVIRGFETQDKITDHWEKYGKSENRQTNIPYFKLEEYKKLHLDLNFDDPIDYEIHYIKTNMKAKKKKFIYFLEHDWGGGLTKYNVDILSHIKEILVGYNQYDIYTNSSKMIPDIINIKYDFMDILEKCQHYYQKGILHINIFPEFHKYIITGFKEIFDKLYQMKKLDIYITIHDLFWFYPNDPNIPIDKMYEISKDKLEILQFFFNHAKLIIFPTIKIFKVYEKLGICFDNIHYKIIPHIDLKDKKINPYYQKIDDEIRVLFIGNFFHIKGSDIYSFLSNQNNISNKLKYYLIGDSTDMVSNKINNLGKYNDSDIFKEINKIKPHLIVLLSIFFETYSYVCTIAKNTGLPIFYNEIVYDERLEDRYNTNVYPYQKNTLIEKYKECINDLIIKGNDNYNMISEGFEMQVPSEYYGLYNSNVIPIMKSLTAQLYDNKEKYELIHKKIKPFCIYFPQYHEVEENNFKFYEKYTDMINLKILKENNLEYDVNTPLDEWIGFYDLIDDDDIIRRQILTARSYGIYGFAMYHYWFSINMYFPTKPKVMYKFIEKLFSNKYDDLYFPIYFIWAIENWNSKLIYGYNNESDWINHFNYLLIFFKNKKYFKIDNKPVFSILGHSNVPETFLKRMIDCWKRLAIKSGFDGLYIILLMHYNYPMYNTCCDAYYINAPAWKNAKLYGEIYKENNTHIVDYNYYLDPWEDEILSKLPERTDKILNIFPGFDNIARNYFKGTISNFKYINANIANFEIYLNKLFKMYNNYKNDSQIFLINAWNEWGENMSVEPSNEYQFQYLECIKQFMFNFVSIPANDYTQL
ncbi:glycosyltransferase [Indivirus ILV1]|uniref:Glycosyltransferase n=1 Tax=Indivirus ILV1 TaxID=1977633 RepID=A0A1V0SDW6_9VIRU|nr:glycosyltransferase [Indivirus ILV1]